MPSLFSENLKLVLKLLSVSPAALASDLRIDKSVISRWLNGSVRPAQHNLARLSALVAARAPGFTVLDWERDTASLGTLFGADVPSNTRATGLPLVNLDEMIASASVRGRAYQGFFRATRPHPGMSGRFLHEHGLIRPDPLGIPRLIMGSSRSRAEGWVIALGGLLYIIAADAKMGTLQFGIFNSTDAARIDAFDGIVLTPASRSPAATPMVCERIGDLSGDDQADERRFEMLAALSPLAPEGSVPERIASHLLRDTGPEQLAKGGELRLSISLLRWLSLGA